MPPVACAVGAVLAILRRDERFLLVRRANPPDQGRWGFPGGRIEPGERLIDAACRELHEETGITATGRGVLTAFETIHHDDAGALKFHYVIVAIICEESDPSGDVRPGDDALEAGWFDLHDIDLDPERVSPGLPELARLALSHRALELVPRPHRRQS